MADIENREQNSKNGRKKKIIAIVTSAVALCLIVAVVLFLLLRPGDEDEGAGNNGPVVSGGPVESQPEEPGGTDEPEQPVEPGPAPERPEDPVIPATSGEAGDEATLRELLSREDDMSVTLTADISVGSPVIVNGKKALFGNKTLSFLPDGVDNSYIIEMSTESELTFDGPTLDGGFRASGIHVGVGANLSFVSGTGRRMAIMSLYTDGGQTVVKDCLFEDNNVYDALVGADSSMFVEGGTWHGPEYSHVQVLSTGYLEVTGNPLFDKSHGVYLAGMISGISGSTLEIHGGKYDMGKDCGVGKRVIVGSGKIDVSYEGDDPDGYIEMCNVTNIAICPSAGCTELNVSGVYVHDSAQGFYLSPDNCTISIKNCRFENMSTGGYLAGSYCTATLENLTFVNNDGAERTLPQGITVMGDNTTCIARNITIDNFGYVAFWAHSKMPLEDLGGKNISTLIIDGYTCKNGADYAILADYGFDVTVKNGNFEGTDNWGAVARNKANLTLENCSFKNSNGRNGTGIWAHTGGTVNAVDCDFSGLTASQGAGVVDVGSSDAGSAGSVTITGKNKEKAKFSGNGTQYSGGVIRIFNGTVKVTGYTFENNNANYAGVAQIKTGDGNNRLEFEDCEFNDNSAKEYGGVLFAEGSTRVIFTDCRFNRNHSLTNKNAGGGVIYSQAGSDITVNGCAFDGNTADAGVGGAVFANGGYIHGGDNVFTNNTAASAGGAIEIASGATVKFEASKNDKEKAKFSGNSTANSGGAIRVMQGSAEISGYKFDGNTGNYAGAIQVKGGTADAPNKLTLNDCEVRNNTATGGSGGAVYAEDNVDIRFTDTLFHSNRALVSYGGGAIRALAGNIICENCDFDSNTANEYGGAIQLLGTNFTGTDCRFANNTGDKGGGALDISSRVDGDKVTSPQVTLKAGSRKDLAIFTGNKVTVEDASAPCIRIMNGKVEITGYTVERHESTYGGAMQIKAGTAEAKNSLKMTDCTVQNNTARYGGAVFAEGNTVAAFSNVKFIENKASYSENKMAGGAVYAQAAEIICTDGCEFTNNGSGNGGGAICINDPAGTFTDSGSVFTGNHADGGDGLNDFQHSGGALYSVGTVKSLDGTRFEGNSAYNGGAVFVTGTVIDMENVEFTGNTCGYRGGALYVKGGTVTGGKCVFTGNKAGSRGGAILIAGGGSLTLVSDDKEYAKFSGNSAENGSGNGSAINITGRDEEGGGSVNITGYTFDDHTAVYGGAIQVKAGTDDLKNTLTLTDCVVKNSTATGAGGAVFAEANTVITLKNSAFTSNKHTVDTRYGGGAVYVQEKSVVTCDGCTFDGNTTVGNGGAVSVGSAGTVFTDKGSVFRNNSAARLGGAVYINTSADFGEANDTAADGAVTSLFENNSAADGGAVYVVSGAVNFHGYTFNKNHAVKGGAVSLARHDQPAPYEFVTLSGCVFGANKATDTDDGNFFPDNLQDQGYGGAVWCGHNNTLTITGVKFTANESNANGALCIRSSTVTGEDCVFTGNTARVGGGVFVGSGGSLSLTRSGDGAECKFDGNIAGSKESPGNAPAIYIENGSVNLNGYTFDGHTGAYGGAIEVKEGTDSRKNTLTLTDCTVKNNTAANAGGAVYAESDTVITLTNSAFTSNKHTVDTRYGGGAVYAHPKSEVICDGCTFDGNTSAGTGGAVYVNGGNIHGSDNVFTNNTAAGGAGAIDIQGGATLEFAASKNDKELAKFSGNSTVSSGGAIRVVQGSAEISGYKFDGNTGNYAGAVQVKGGTVGAANKLTLTDCEVNGNSAVFGGFAFAEANTVITLGGTVFTGNSATNQGGALYMNGAGEINSDGCTFNENHSVNEGGAISLTNADAVLTDNGSAFTGNYSAKGGALSLKGKAKKDGGAGLVGTTFSGNRTEGAVATGGGAVYIAGGELVGENCRFENNSVANTKWANGGGAIFVDANGEGVKGKLTLTGDDKAKAVFTGNRVTNAGQGGAIFMNDNKAEVNITGYLFENNEAESNNSGAIAVRGGALNLKDTSFIGNKGQNGGAMYIMSGAVVTIEGTNPSDKPVFNKNHAKEHGGAIVVATDSTSVTIKNVKFGTGADANTADKGHPTVQHGGGTINHDEGVEYYSEN